MMRTPFVRMLAAWLNRHRSPAIAVAVVAGIGLLGGFLWTHRSPDRPLRVAFQNSPPYHFPDANGNPTGPAVDVLKEAARRQNIRLEWRYSIEGPERALSSGAVDLWPIVGDLPERR